MAGVEIDVDSNEYQSWYISFSKFQPQAIFEAQHKISEILTKYFDDSNRTKRQKQSYYYATELWRDNKIPLMRKLRKIKSTLRLQLSDDFASLLQTTNHLSKFETTMSFLLVW